MAATADLPDFCLVLADIRPVDPEAPLIKVQVNLPTEWNGNKLQFGGDGFNGNLITGLGAGINSSPADPLPIADGYMTAGTDSGHQNGGGEIQGFAQNQEALTNFAYAAYKKTHDLAIQVGRLYYGETPQHSYYMGASEGGREALAMAQRYPADFDGVIAVDPVVNWTALQIFGNYIGGILQSAPNAWLGSRQTLVNNAVLNACDSIDGITDLVVSDYVSCAARAPSAINALQCSGESSECLSHAQLAVLQAAHAGFSFDFPLANNVTAYPGFLWGGEGILSNWQRLAGAIAPSWSGPPTAAGSSLLYTFGNGTIRYFIVQDPEFDPLTFSPNDYQARVQAVSALMDATDPDLGEFFERGGKLILKEDMADSAQSPIAGIRYRTSVVNLLGDPVTNRSFVAYAMPGLGHTSRGVTPGTPSAPTYGIPGFVDLLGTLENWVEDGTPPPSSLTATLQQTSPPFAVTASKPMCFFPKFAQYVGPTAGDGSLAENYSCATPPRP